MTEKEEKLEKKIEKDFKEFYSEVQGLSVDELKTKLTTHAKHREETIKAKEDDEGLAIAKKEASDLEAPYKDTMKNLNLRTKYLYLLMKRKGGG